MAQVGSLSKRQKLGYCSGILAEGLLYNMYYSFYLFFLTNVVQLNAMRAGTVIFISIIWDAVTDPLVGAYADRQGADKRKFMAKAAIPMALSFVACFIKIDIANDTLKTFYYIAVTMLLWLAYTVYTIPYYAVVADITPDYDERTDIRGTSALINAAGIFTGNALPAQLPLMLIGLVGSAALGWTVTAAVLGSISIVFSFIAVKSLKTTVIKKAGAARGKQKSIPQVMMSFVEVARLKPFKWFTLFIFFFLMTFSMMQTNFIYLITVRMGLVYNDVMVYVIILLVATIAVMTPVVTKVSEIKDRRFATILFFSISITGLVAAKIIGVTSLPMLMFVAFFLAIGAADFWAVFYSLAYDLVEVDEFVHGERREGIITSLPQFFQKFGSAVGIWSVGLMLSLSGYDEILVKIDKITGIIKDPIVFTDKMKSMVENTSTIIPAAILLISIFGIAMFPVSKKRYHLLQDALTKKKAGEAYSTEGLERLV